jgi:hypothetical protein
MFSDCRYILFPNMQDSSQGLFFAEGASICAMVFTYRHWFFAGCPLADDCSKASFHKVHSWNSEDRFL